MKKLSRRTLPQTSTKYIHIVNPCILSTIKWIMPIARSNFCVSLWFLSHVTFWLRANHILDGDNKDACQLKKITKSYLFEYFNKWKCYQEWSITQIIKLIKVPFIWEDCIHVLQKICKQNCWNYCNEIFNDSYVICKVCFFTNKTEIKNLPNTSEKQISTLKLS